MSFRKISPLLQRAGLQILIIISVIGTGTTQIVASSSSEYAINKTYNKRFVAASLDDLYSICVCVYVMNA